jgi:hypothetical protein
MIITDELRKTMKDTMFESVAGSKVALVLTLKDLLRCQRGLGDAR